MSNYMELGLPEAWKPLMRAMADAGWELAKVIDGSNMAGCRHLLEFSESGATCYLSFWNEPEWCGNHLQGLGLTVAALTRNLPRNRESADDNGLLLTGGWASELLTFVANISSQAGEQFDANQLTTSCRQS